jgi:hypothetical protein
MFLAGIQAKLGLDPRLKHSGVTNSGHVILVYRYPAACCGVVQLRFDLADEAEVAGSLIWNDIGYLGHLAELVQRRAGILAMWYHCRMLKLKQSLYLSFLVLFGCSTAKTSPGATFFVGLNGYQDEMEKLEGRPERWSDRQRAGDSLKKTYLVSFGGSREFNRMVDLDVRRREFLITLRHSSVKPDRVKEMKDELTVMNNDVDALKEIVKGQAANAELRAQQQPQQLETVATLGLINMAIDSFASMIIPAGPNPPSTKVGRYIVSDFGGLLSTVTTPEGQTLRCTTLVFPEAGASIKCEPPGTKS